MTSDEQPAYRIAPGSFVRAEIDGHEAVCLKVERLGRDFVNHYLVPLDPLPGPREALMLRYVDPAEPLAPCDEPLDLLVEPMADAPAAVGTVLRNARGLFLKVHDTPNTGRSFAYVELATGMVAGRQERGVAGVLRWRLARGVESQDVV